MASLKLTQAVWVQSGEERIHIVHRTFEAECAHRFAELGLADGTGVVVVPFTKNID